MKHIAGNAPYFGKNGLPILASIDLRERRVQGDRLFGIEFQHPLAVPLLDEIKATGSLLKAASTRAGSAVQSEGNATSPG